MRTCNGGDCGITVIRELSTARSLENVERPDRLDPSVASANVLVIDDEAMIRELLSEILIRDGHAVTAVASSREGLQAFEEGCYDLVYTDLAMPETSGWEIASEIKKKDPCAIVIMVTGWGVQVDDKNVRENGIDLVISKPFQIREIRDSIAQAMQVKAKTRPGQIIPAGG
jgi:DNA-binding response OmpR family regulator